jgi:CIC family chloride channel protein
MLGGVFGRVANAAWPDVTAPAGAYGLVGMGALFAGVAHAPMTAIIILFEMTGDYRIIGPLMVACVVSSLLSEFLGRESIYTRKLVRRGVDVFGAEPDLTDAIAVREAMTTDLTPMPQSASVPELLAMFARGDAASIPIVDRQGALIGIVSRSDAEDAVLQASSDATAGDIMTPDPVTCAADESLTLALQRLTSRDVAALPVVDSDEPGRVIGMLRRRDIIAAYHRARQERPEIAARLDRLRESVGGARMFEAEIQHDSLLADTEVRALSLPPDTLLVAVRRGGRTLIPRGDTVLHPGDRVVALAERAQIEALTKLFARRRDE